MPLAWVIVVVPSGSDRTLRPSRRRPGPMAGMGPGLRRGGYDGGSCSVLLRERFDRGGDPIGLLDLRIMPRVGDALEAGVGKRSGEALAVGGFDDAVLVAPQ